MHFNILHIVHDIIGYNLLCCCELCSAVALKENTTRMFQLVTYAVCSF